uniref:RNA helicase n=1 Tax=Haemonchus contortus TaxID=6289 RepID=A0A7I4XVN1_HAECO
MDRRGDCEDWDFAPAANGEQLPSFTGNSRSAKKQQDEDDWGPVVANEDDWGLKDSALSTDDDTKFYGNSEFGGGFTRTVRGRGAITSACRPRNFGTKDDGFGAEDDGFESSGGGFADRGLCGKNVVNRRGGGNSCSPRGPDSGKGDDVLGSDEDTERSAGFGERVGRSFQSRDSGFGGASDDFDTGKSDFERARGRGGFVRGRGFGVFGSRNAGFGSKDATFSGDDSGPERGVTNSFRGRGGFSSKGTNSDFNGCGFGSGLDGFSRRNSGFGGRDASNSNKSEFGSDSVGFGSGATSSFGSERSGFRQGSTRLEEGSLSCYNCGEAGHRSRDCTSSDKARSNRGRSFGGSHFNATGFSRGSASRFGDNEGNDFGGDRGEERLLKCFKCNNEGHRSSECPMQKSNTCYNCGAEDHISRECTNPPRMRRSGNDEAPRKLPSTFVPEDEDIEVLFRDRIEQGEMFTKLFEAEVTLTEGGLRGRSEKGKKITSFDELELTEQLSDNVANAGYKYPTPIQQYAVPAIFKGRDIMACAQTGSGKTAAFLLPVMTALMRTGNLSNSAESTCCPRCLIIAPTRELAVQIYNESRKFAFKTVIRVACCYGGTSVMAQRQSIRGASILVATVGRLKQFISDGYISLREIKYLILDEADRMLELGFEDSMNFILNHPSLAAKEERQTFMFSATFPPDVQAIAAQQLKADFLMITVGKIGVANKCITQEIIACSSVTDKKEKFFELLNIDLKKYEIHKEADVFKEKTMVFVSRKLFADFLGVLLSECGIPSTTIHGDRIQNQRAKAINEFKYGKKPVLIATAVGERGLDIKGVDHVINYDLPTNIQDYVHRIGRTGRVGNPGRATSLYLSEENKGLAQSLVEILTEAGQHVPEFLAKDADEGSGRFFGLGFGRVGETNNVAEEEEDWD